MGSHDDPFSADPKELCLPKTFWLKKSTLSKLKRVQDLAPNPEKVIASVKRAIENEIDRLSETAPAKKKNWDQNSSS